MPSSNSPHSTNHSGSSNLVKSFFKILGWFLVGMLFIAAIPRLLAEGKQLTDNANGDPDPNSPLANPYGPYTSCEGDFSAIPKPLNANDCVYTQLVTAHRYDGIYQSTTDCLRRMKMPASKCYEKAKKDAVTALLNGDHYKFEAIMRSWPIKNRKAIHDYATSKAGIKFTMAAFDPNEVKDLSDIQRFQFKPFHRTPLSENKLVEKDIIFVPETTTQYTNKSISYAK